MNKEPTKNIKRENTNDGFISSSSKRFKKDEERIISKRKHDVAGPLTDTFKAREKSLLPGAFKDLMSTFAALDVVVNKLAQSKETAYIDKVTRFMNEMNQKSFDRTVFGQILTVFPESYKYGFDGSKRLSIAANLNFGLNDNKSPRKTAKSLSLGQLIVRLRTLEERLLEVVREWHDDHLVLVKGMRTEDVRSMRELRRWSGDFDVESVPMIVARNLEDPPAVLPDVVRPCASLWGPQNPAESPRHSFCSQNVHEPKERPKVELEVKDPQEDRKSILLRRQRLPFHLRYLLDVFIGCDRAIHSLLAREETPAMGAVLRVCKTHSEGGLRRAIAVYPHAYRLRWASVPGRPRVRRDLVLTPDLRRDGTRASLSSPVKGHVPMDVRRLKERADVFLALCEHLVEAARLSHSSCLYGGGQEAPIFQGDVHVPMVTPIDFPVDPMATQSASRVLRAAPDLFRILKRRPLYQYKDEFTPSKPSTNNQFVGPLSEKLWHLPEGLLERLQMHTTVLDGGVLTVEGQWREVIAGLPGLMRAIVVEADKTKVPGSLVPVATVLRGTRITLGAFRAAMAALEELCPGAVRLAGGGLHLEAGAPSVASLTGVVAAILTHSLPTEAHMDCSRVN